MPHPTVLELPKNTSAHWGKLYGSSAALAIAEKARSSDQLTLVVTATTLLILKMHCDFLPKIYRY